MNKIRTNVFREGEELKKQLEYKTKQADDWQNKYYELLNELKKTQELLRQFLNENTPSSKLPFKINDKENKKEPKPRGKPLGSNGGNKEAPKNVDRKISAKLEGKCPRCGKVIRKKNIDTRLRYIYDAEIKPMIIEVEEEVYP